MCRHGGALDPKSSSCRPVRGAGERVGVRPLAHAGDDADVEVTDRHGLSQAVRPTPACEASAEICTPHFNWIVAVGAPRRDQHTLCAHRDPSFPLELLELVEFLIIARSVAGGGKVCSFAADAQVVLEEEEPFAGDLLLDHELQRRDISQRVARIQQELAQVHDGCGNHIESLGLWRLVDPRRTGRTVSGGIHHLGRSCIDEFHLHLAAPDDQDDEGEGGDVRHDTETLAGPHGRTPSWLLGHFAHPNTRMLGFSGRGSAGSILGTCKTTHNAWHIPLKRSNLLYFY